MCLFSTLTPCAPLLPSSSLPACSASSAHHHPQEPLVNFDIRRRRLRRVHPTCHDYHREAFSTVAGDAASERFGMFNRFLQRAVIPEEHGSMLEAWLKQLWQSPWK